MALLACSSRMRACVTLLSSTRFSRVSAVYYHQARVLAALSLTCERGEDDDDTAREVAGKLDQLLLVLGGEAHLDVRLDRLRAMKLDVAVVARAFPGSAGRLKPAEFVLRLQEVEVEPVQQLEEHRYVSKRPSSTVSRQAEAYLDDGDGAVANDERRADDRVHLHALWDVVLAVEGTMLNA